MSLIKLFRNKEFFEAKKEIFRLLDEEKESILEEYKKWLSTEILSEAGRFKIVRVRIRRGKIERRKKVSTIKGFTVRNGKMKRMSQKERLKRRMGQRRGKIKRKAKKNRALVKRKRSIRRLKAMGGMRKKKK